MEAATLWKERPSGRENCASKGTEVGRWGGTRGKERSVKCGFTRDPVSRAWGRDFIYALLGKPLKVSEVRK